MQYRIPSARSPMNANPPDERTPFDPARFPRRRTKASRFDLPQTQPAPILDGTAPRRRGRPRKETGTFQKVGYDPDPTVIDDPPECDESAGQQPRFTDSASRKPDGRSTRKRALPGTGAKPGPTGSPAVRSRRAAQRPSAGTPAESPDRSGVHSLPERMFTPSRATEIEATPTPDYPLAHDAAGQADRDLPQPENLQGVSLKNENFADLDGEDFDIDQKSVNLRTVYAKNAENRMPETDPAPIFAKRELDPTSFQLPSRRVTNGTDSPIRRSPRGLPEAPVAEAERISAGAPERDRTTARDQIPAVPPILPDGAEPDSLPEVPSRTFSNRESDPEPETPRRRARRTPELRDRPDGQGDREPDRRYYDDGALCGWLSDPEYGNAPMGNDRERFHCISIIGQIEGHCLLPEGQKATKYEHVIPTLVSVEEDDRVDGLLVILNTMGGDVEAGLAIAEMIASMTKPTVSLVLGGGHSIGVPLATAANYSLIVPSATMTIHPVRVSGMVIGVPQSFRYMSEMQERITAFICSHSKANPDDIRELMMRPDQIATDCGSIIDGNEAVRYGIIDEVGGLDRALAVLREMCAARKENK